MKRHSCLLIMASFCCSLSAQPPAQKTARDGLKPFHDLIGSWRCTGTPAGSREEQQKNFWTETLAVEWQFKGQDAWLKLDFDKGKHFTKGELRYRPATDDFELKLATTKKENSVYTGRLNERQLAMERTEGDLIHRLNFSLLHHNRFTYSYSTRPANKSLVTAVWKVGATKEGESFAAASDGPECIVSGGKGTMAVTYQGKTYYVCCSGCRSEFNESPQKYIDEYNAKKAKKAR